MSVPVPKGVSSNPTSVTEPPHKDIYAGLGSACYPIQINMDEAGSTESELMSQQRQINLQNIVLKIKWYKIVLEYNFLKFEKIKMYTSFDKIGLQKAYLFCFT